MWPMSPTAPSYDTLYNLMMVRHWEKKRTSAKHKMDVRTVPQRPSITLYILGYPLQGKVCRTRH
jgi:hypothetical protein